MAWIDTIDEEDALGTLERLFRRITRRAGSVDNILKIHGLSPRSLDAHLQLYETLMFASSPLSRRQRECIGVVVSAANDCHY